MRQTATAFAPASVGNVAVGFDVLGHSFQAIGDRVTARKGLVVIEEMKMENELRSPKAGKVTETRVPEGTSVEAGTTLAVVE